MTEAAPLGPGEQERLLWLLRHLERKHYATVRSLEGGDRGLLEAAETVHESFRCRAVGPVSGSG